MHTAVSLFSALLCVASLAAQPPAAKPAFKLSADEQAVLDLTNSERKKEKLPALRPSELLTKAAREHSANMAKQQKLDHVLDDKKPDERLNALSYRFVAMAENIAMAQRTPAEAIATWMSSTAGHKENLLSKDYTEIGIGIAVDKDGQRYWTQVFAAPATPK
jgi:uncharacterized protein YkwD